MVDLLKINMKLFLNDIIELRERNLKGLNNNIYTYINPWQDKIYVRKMKNLINTYLNLKKIMEEEIILKLK